MEVRICPPLLVRSPDAVGEFWFYRIETMREHSLEDR
jgi:hypothetical protein